jgi:hypothetical protein
MRAQDTELVIRGNNSISHFDLVQLAFDFKLFKEKE